jgi:transposase
MARPIRVDWTESAAELYQRFIAEQDVSRRKRLQALWLVREGHSLAEASELAGVARRSLERWLGWYREDGLPAVLERVPGHGARGAASRLTAEQQTQLLAEVTTGRFRTYDEARDWIAQTFGVRYSYQGVYSVLARLEVHPKVPRPMAAKADPAVQAAWKKGA